MVKVTAAQFAAKYQDKVEAYRFLSSDAGVYLPDSDNVTVWHLRDLAAGRRTIIKAQNIKHLHVPQFKELAIKHMMEYAKGVPKVMKAFPSEVKEIDKLPRQYIINVIYTLVGKPFELWVNQRIENRHAKIAEDRDLNIELDPEIAAIFQASNAVSGKLPQAQSVLHSLSYILRAFFLSQISIITWAKCIKARTCLHDILLFHSRQGQLAQPDEGQCQEEEVKEAD